MKTYSIFLKGTKKQQKKHMRKKLRQIKRRFIIKYYLEKFLAAMLIVLCFCGVGLFAIVLVKTYILGIWWLFGVNLFIFITIALRIICDVL